VEDAPLLAGCLTHPNPRTSALPGCELHGVWFEANAEIRNSVKCREVGKKKTTDTCSPKVSVYFILFYFLGLDCNLSAFALSTLVWDDFQGSPHDEGRAAVDVPQILGQIPRVHTTSRGS
jgi:hypothetical protein